MTSYFYLFVQMNFFKSISNWWNREINDEIKADVNSIIDSLAQQHLKIDVKSISSKYVSTHEEVKDGTFEIVEAQIESYMSNLRSYIQRYYSNKRDVIRSDVNDIINVHFKNTFISKPEEVKQEYLNKYPHIILFDDQKFKDITIELMLHHNSIIKLMLKVN